VDLTIGTLNLTHRFSRFNFRAEIPAILPADPSIESTAEYKFSDAGTYEIRTYKGRLVKGKPAEARQQLAGRLQTMQVDVLAVQEVEDIGALRMFNRDDLGGMYEYQILVEGNDPRLIDVGLLSKLPIGAITSWQRAVHPANPGEPVFGRDVLEVEVFDPARTNVLFTLFINHLKSHYVDFGDDPIVWTEQNNTRRHQQSEVLQGILTQRMQPNSRYIVLGDMNDPPTSAFLAPFAGDPGLGLTNALSDPTETRPPKADNPPPPSPAWTTRFKPSGQPAQYELFDQIWLSPELAGHQTGAWIDRRTKHSGDGSDHDPAWVQLTNL